MCGESSGKGTFLCGIFFALRANIMKLHVLSLLEIKSLKLIIRKRLHVLTKNIDSHNTVHLFYIKKMHNIQEWIKCIKFEHIKVICKYANIYKNIYFKDKLQAFKRQIRVIFFSPKNILKMMTVFFDNTFFPVFSFFKHFVADF